MPGFLRRGRWLGGGDGIVVYAIHHDALSPPPGKRNMPKPSRSDQPDESTYEIVSPASPSQEDRLNLARTGVVSCEALYADEEGAPVIFGLRFWDASNQLVKQRSLPSPFLPALEGCLTGMLPSGAIQENNGYSGVLTVNAGMGTVKITHEERLIGNRESTFEFSV